MRELVDGDRRSVGQSQRDVDGDAILEQLRLVVGGAAELADAELVVLIDWDVCSVELALLSRRSFTWARIAGDVDVATAVAE
ncbi:MAG: hypothetical protein ABJE66_20755 [Deltaproteobacteria bacterium]